jgi:hypothetical protein
MEEELKQKYGKLKSEFREKADALRKEKNVNLDLKKNESYKEVETK